MIWIIKPSKATTKAIIATLKLKVGRFLLVEARSGDSDFFWSTGVWGGAEEEAPFTGMEGGSEDGFTAGATSGAGTEGGVALVFARMGFGGKFNLGSFSKGAETAPSSALLAGGLVFINKLIEFYPGPINHVIMMLSMLF